MTHGKESACQAGYTRDLGSILRLGRYSGGGNGNPLQYSHLENSMVRGAWWATVHGVEKSCTWLSMHACKTGVLTAAWSLHEYTVFNHSTIIVYLAIYT